METIQLEIDGKKVEAERGTTLLQAARKAGIVISGQGRWAGRNVDGVAAGRRYEKTRFRGFDLLSRGAQERTRTSTVLPAST